MNYIKDGYSQNLIVNQKKIKDQMTLFIQNRISEEIKDKKFTQNNQDTINNKISKFLESDVL